MKKLVLALLLSAAADMATAQSAGPSTLNATGNTKVIGGNEFEWSVGEMTMVSTLSTSGVIVTQGVLQPSAQDKLGIETTVIPAGKLQVFPSPASSVVNIQYLSQDNGTLTYRLMDMNGRQIAKEAISLHTGSNPALVDVSKLACATYLLEIITNDGKTAATTYQIQKIK